ncbi:MAG: PQQ-binding-like beta-propeller repeat protein [Chloroflexota bacterium]|nr:PQQ-binding-like beta-propeller repeat protein [Chloroflexota bacterium]
MASRFLVMVHPVAGDGAVYVEYPVLTADRTQTQYTIAALRASDGAMLWSIANTNFTSRLAFVDGKLILLGDDMVALRATDGTALWQDPLNWNWQASLLYRDGILYFSNGFSNGSASVGDGAVIYAIRLADGRTLWQTPVSGITGPTAPVLDGNSLYVGVFNGVIAALRTDTGAIRWQAPFASAQSNDATPLAMIGGKLLVRTPRGNLLLNPANGGGEEDAPPPFDTASRVDSLAVGRTTFLGLSDGSYSLFASDGRLIWSAPTNAPVGMSVVAYDADTLYLGPGPSVYDAISMSDGAVLWNLRPDLRSSRTFRASGYAAIPGYFFETADGASTPCTPIDSHLPAIRALSSADGRVIWEDTFSVALGPPSCAVCHAR